jgi:tRNA threonylcarbamoyladenosine biosynthesis protein TsaE
MVVNFTLDDIDQAAQTFLGLLPKKTPVVFHGEMGAGKTTFIQAVCRQLGVQDVMSSPTFSIINEYAIASGGTIFHIDLYRLKGETEALATGIEDCFYYGDYCFVEWPERAPSIFPEGTINCYIQSSGTNERKLLINL